MKTLIIINLVALGVLALTIFTLSGDFELAGITLAGAGVIAASGALSAYFWFKRGRVYERRGERGPDE